MLNNRFHIVKRISAGAFGETFLAEDAHLPSRRKCIVKRLKRIPDPKKFEIVKERFEREAAVLETLGDESNGAIPKLYARFAENDEFYLVQEFIAGQTLGERIKAKTRIDEAAARDIFAQLLETLDFIHARNVIHRDIKPDNIILREPTDRPVLIDFGLVKEVTDLAPGVSSSTSIMAGTQGYMAVEQMIGKPKPGSDVFALARTMAHALTGIPPLDMVDSHLQEVMWRGVAKGVSDEFAEVINRAMEIKLADRFKSAREALNALRSRLAPSLRNSIGMEFVLVPAGKFMMGSNAYDSEKPIHEVTISAAFYMGKYQVTQGEWTAVMGNNPSRFKGDDRLPVERVSWDDCQEFITRLNARKDGYAYRLPSEAEWEYACRAGTTGEYAGELDEMAWYGEDSGLKTHPVGEKNANAWGLHDMHGNVWEWCQDRYHENYNGVPTDGRAWEQGSDNGRVVRGGSWYSRADICRAAVRGYYAPALRSNGYGFRLVAARIP
jgi:eukaryotic-like serine/threonine-protein kinase